MAKRIILTRKIQLHFNTTDPDARAGYWQQLCLWQSTCHKAANYIYTHLFVQEQVKDLLYLTDEVRTKLADARKDENGILTTSRTNSTYQLLSRHFKGTTPTDILSSLNNSLNSLFLKERALYCSGARSIRNYRNNIPMPFSAASMRHWQKTEHNEFSFELFGIPFRTYLGKDYYDKRMILERVVAQQTKLCTSSLQIDKGKIYLLAAMEHQQEQLTLQPGTIARASLSVEIPIVVSIHKSRYEIGNKEEFLHQRLAIQAAVARTQKGTATHRGGHGCARKLKSLDKYRGAEARYIQQKLHVYSRRLIDCCIKHNAGSLVLVNQTEAAELTQADQFLLRNWSYGALKQKITYKAAKAGITIIEE